MRSVSSQFRVEHTGDLTLTNRTISAQEQSDFEILLNFNKEFTCPRSILPIETKIATLSSEQIKKFRQQKVLHVASLLGIGFPQAGVFLWHYQWDVENLLNDLERNSLMTISRHAGIEVSSVDKLDKILWKAECASDIYQCPVCFESQSSLQCSNFFVFKMSCGHSACIDCYRDYVQEKVLSGISTLMRCLEINCNYPISQDIVVYLFSHSTYKTNISNSTQPSDKSKIVEKYDVLLNKEFVSQVKNMKYCPAPDCQFAIQNLSTAHKNNFTSSTVLCKCGKLFCFKCGKDDHMPATCNMAEFWNQIYLKYMAGRDAFREMIESESWIKQFTEKCPNCQSPIEKNGGCNQICCRKCSHQFCWICKANWASLHYECRSGSTGAPVSENSNVINCARRVSLSNFETYLKQHKAHLEALKSEKIIYESIRETIHQNSDCYSQYFALKKAFQVLAIGRSASAWSYTFAFFMTNPASLPALEKKQKFLDSAIKKYGEIFKTSSHELLLHRLKFLKIGTVTYPRAELLKLISEEWQKGRITFKELEI